jgi:hypothetical protein
MKSILIVAYVLENILIRKISRPLRGIFSIFPVFNNNHNVLNTASETSWLSLTMGMMERVHFTVSDTTEKHFATLHTSDKKEQKLHCNFEFNCFWQDAFCTISICGLDNYLWRMWRVPSVGFLLKCVPYVKILYTCFH